MIYPQPSDRASETAHTIWNVLGWRQLAGLAMTLVTTFKEQRRPVSQDPTMTHGQRDALQRATAYARLPAQLVCRALGAAARPKPFLDGLVHHRHRLARLHSKGSPSMAIRLRRLGVARASRTSPWRRLRTSLPAQYQEPFTSWKRPSIYPPGNQIGFHPAWKVSCVGLLPSALIT